MNEKTNLQILHKQSFIPPARTAKRLQAHPKKERKEKPTRRHDNLCKLLSAQMTISLQEFKKKGIFFFFFF